MNSVERETSGDFRRGLLAIGEIIQQIFKENISDVPVWTCGHSQIYTFETDNRGTSINTSGGGSGQEFFKGGLGSKSAGIFIY